MPAVVTFLCQTCVIFCDFLVRPEHCGSVQVRRALGSAAAAPLASRNRDAARAANVLGEAAAAANAAGSGSAAMRGAAALQSIEQLVAGIKLRRDTAREGAHRTTAQVCPAQLLSNVVAYACVI
jgi:hypothetical protein